MTAVRRYLSELFADSPAVGVGYWFFVGHVLAIFGIALSNAFLGLALLFVLIAWRRLPWRHLSLEATDRLSLNRPLALTAIVFVVSVVTSYDIETSAAELPNLFTLTTLPLAWLLVRGESEVRRIYDLLLILMAVWSLYGIGQYLFTDYGPLLNRIPGPFPHYMTFSGVLLLGDCLLLARLVTNGGRRSLLWLSFALVNVTLILTLTRSAWIAAGIVLTAALWIRFRRLFVLYLGALIVLAAISAVAAPQHWQRFRSIVDVNNPSNYDRLCMLYAGSLMVEERPLFGIGPEMVARLYPIYRHPTAPRARVAHLHSTFVQLAAETGLVSLFAYLWLMGAGLLAAIRALRRDGGLTSDRADLYLGVILALVAFNVAGLFEANWRDTEVQRVVLFLLAVPFCVGLQKEGSEAVSESP